MPESFCLIRSALANTPSEKTTSSGLRRLFATDWFSSGDDEDSDSALRQPVVGCVDDPPFDDVAGVTQCGEHDREVATAL